MPKKKAMEKRINLRMPETLYTELEALAIKHKRDIADVARMLLEAAVKNEAAVNGIDVITATIRRVLRSELKPVEDRLAKLSAKGAIAGATSMYLNTMVIKQHGRYDVHELYKNSRAKAVAYLREPLDPVDVDK